MLFIPYFQITVDDGLIWTLACLTGLFVLWTAPCIHFWQLPRSSLCLSVYSHYYFSFKIIFQLKRKHAMCTKKKGPNHWNTSTLALKRKQMSGLQLNQQKLYNKTPFSPVRWESLVPIHIPAVWLLKIPWTQRVLGNHLFIHFSIGKILMGFHFTYALIIKHLL